MNTSMYGASSWVVFPIVLAGWIFSLCLHEFSHALVAFRGGDYSVRDKGYLSFNPLRYIDPQLSILLPLLFLFFGGLGLPGGAVYIDRRRLYSPLWESAVSLAGPVSNALLAVLLALPFRFMPDALNNSFGAALAFLVLLQVCAVVLNLLPVPGLDGFNLWSPWLPPRVRLWSHLYGRNAMMLLFFAFWIPGFSFAFWGTVHHVLTTLGVPDALADAGQRAFMFWR